MFLSRKKKLKRHLSYYYTFFCHVCTLGQKKGMIKSFPRILISVMRRAFVKNSIGNCEDRIERTRRRSIGVDSSNSGQRVAGKKKKKKMLIFIDNLQPSQVLLYLRAGELLMETPCPPNASRIRDRGGESSCQQGSPINRNRCF